MKPTVNVRVEFDDKKLTRKIEKASEAALPIVMNEALKDANAYARMDTGEMIRSSIRASEPEKGRLVWDTPYARKVYYAGSPAHDSNPNARLLWAHFAYTQNRDKYIKMLDKLAKEKL